MLTLREVPKGVGVVESIGLPYIAIEAANPQIHDSLRLFFKNLCAECIFLLTAVRESSIVKE